MDLVVNWDFAVEVGRLDFSILWKCLIFSNILIFLKFDWDAEGADLDSLETLKKNDVNKWANPVFHIGFILLHCLRCLPCICLILPLHQKRKKKKKETGRIPLLIKIWYTLA